MRQLALHPPPQCVSKDHRAAHLNDIFMYVYSTFCYIKFVRASGEAILDTQRYFTRYNLSDLLTRYNLRDLRDTTYAIQLTRYNLSTSSKHFTQALYPSTLHKHFIQALYTSTLSKHFTQALYQSTLSKHFIKVFLKHFRNTCQGITKVLRQGIKTR